MQKKDIDFIIKLNRKDQETNILNNTRLNEAAEEINKILSDPIYNNSRQISSEDLVFTDNFLTNSKNHSRKEVVDVENNKRLIIPKVESTSPLSEILFDIYFPKPKETFFFHYTKISALRGILKGSLKLKNLVKNDNYEEFKSFYKDHNILGIFQNSLGGKNLRDLLMNEIFALCFASKINLSEKSDNSLWNSFGDSHHGVRIEFEIDSKHPDFRKIMYRKRDVDTNDLPVKRINDRCETLFNRKLLVAGISKIGAFYLPGSYKIENEVRFCIKKDSEKYDLHYPINNNSLTIPLENEYGNFQINKIKIGKECSPEERASIIKIVEENNYSVSILE